mmetsp:Transcript_6572/g.12072  ORF Transcript_6572/g.12072 Transcript_6572/m.12072 type:complete len:236 (-) Transcript_6572:608-1315(-)
MVASDKFFVFYFCIFAMSCCVLPPQDMYKEYESPKNQRIVLRNVPVRRSVTHASLSESEEKSTSSDREEDSLSDSSELEQVAESNPMDMISAAATTVEFCEQSCHLEILERQCMIVQQDFDFMLAEQEELLVLEEEKRRDAENRAREAKELNDRYETEMMTLKVKMFQMAAEIKAKDAILTKLKKCKSLDAAVPGPEAEALGAASKRRRGDEGSSGPPRLVASGGTRKRQRRGSF